MSRKSSLFGAALALVGAAASGWQGASFNLGSIMARFKSKHSPGEKERPTSYARKTGLTVAAAKRASIKAKNRAKHRAHMKGRA